MIVGSEDKPTGWPSRSSRSTSGPSRDGFIAALPFMIVGSFTLVFIFPASQRPSGALPGLALTAGTYQAQLLLLPFQLAHGADDPFISRWASRCQPGQANGWIRHQACSA